MYTRPTRNAVTAWMALCAILTLLGCTSDPDSLSQVSDEPAATAEKSSPNQASPEATPAVAVVAARPAAVSETARPAAKKAEPIESTSAASAAPADPSRDWTYWRGPQWNGTSRETGLVEEFDPDGGEGSHVAWKRDDLGGRSTPIVMEGKLYTIVRADPETEHEGERVVCVDANTGKTLWENRFNVWLSDVPDTRVGWSSVVGDPETNRVYALGVSGYFQCIDAETGETVWDHPLHENFGLLSTYGGRTNHPIVFEDLVIISGVIIGWGDMAKPAHRFLAFDKMTGEVVWFSGTRLLPYDTTYSAPVLAVLGGQRALVFGSGDGAVWAVQPRTGEPIWHYNLSRRGLNTSPLVVGDKVFMGHSEENIDGTTMGAIVAIDGTGEGTLDGPEHVLWKELGLMMGRSSPVPIDDRLYWLDDRAKLHVISMETGETLSTKNLGTVMRSSPLYADGKLYIFTANGRWYLLEPTDSGVEILSRGRLPSGEEVHASPIAAQHKLFVQSTGALYCLEDPQKPSQAAPPKEVVAEETPIQPNDSPAHVQIVPAELLLEPGEVADFQVRLFNERGQFLQEAEGVSFEVAGAGEVAENGRFRAPHDAAHTSATVIAKSGELNGRSRVRIVPSLPWKFDFEGLNDPPVTWVGARYRHVVREIDGNQVMVKITTIPKGTRSRCWFGQPTLHDYTMTADVRGELRQGKLPDIGLIAQGYTLDLQGQNQVLQLRSWVPHDKRTQQTVEFPWKGDIWYAMKLQASVEDGKAVLRGKVWPHDEDEPEEWTVEMTDEAPNVQGSPGLYGNAKDAEIYLDNIEVSPNSPSPATAG